MESITKLATTSLHAHPLNTEYFDDAKDAAFENLKDSIKTLGVLTPLRVAPDMTILSGHQRWKACMELGVDTVPCIVSEDAMDEDTKEIELIASNFGRLKNDPIKQAKMIQEYERLNGVHRGRRSPEETGNNSLISKSQQQIADELGVDVTTLRNLKRLNTLPEEFQQLIQDGKLSATTGYKVIASLTEDEQVELLKQLGQLDGVQKYTAALIQQRIEALECTDEAILKERDDAKKAKENAEKMKRSALEGMKEEKRRAEEAQAKLDRQESRLQELEKKASFDKFARETLEKQVQDLEAQLKAERQGKTAPVPTPPSGQEAGEILMNVLMLTQEANQSIQSQAEAILHVDENTRMDWVEALTLIQKNINDIHSTLVA